MTQSQGHGRQGPIMDHKPDYIHIWVFVLKMFYATFKFWQNRFVNIWIPFLSFSWDTVISFITFHRGIFAFSKCNTILFFVYYLTPLSKGHNLTNPPSNMEMVKTFVHSAENLVHKLSEFIFLKMSHFLHLNLIKF